jgi:S-DNA-T family DNA segregation ATPase FtsK/SpoIIIE
LRLIARSIIRHNTPEEARLLIADTRRHLFDAVPAPYQLGYTVSTSTLSNLVGEVASTVQSRLPGVDVSPDRLRLHDWWSGPHIFVLVDDFDLMSGGHTGPLDPLLELLPQGAATGLHLIVARTSAGAGRAMMTDATLRRLWDLGTNALLFSYDKAEGVILGDAKPRRLPQGRAQLVNRKLSPALVHTALQPASTEQSHTSGPRLR